MGWKCRFYTSPLRSLGTPPRTSDSSSSKGNDFGCSLSVTSSLDSSLVGSVSWIDSRGFFSLFFESFSALFTRWHIIFSTVLIDDLTSAQFRTAGFFVFGASETTFSGTFSSGTFSAGTFSVWLWSWVGFVSLDSDTGIDLLSVISALESVTLSSTDEFRREYSAFCSRKIPHFEDLSSSSFWNTNGTVYDDVITYIDDTQHKILVTWWRR